MWSLFPNIIAIKNGFEKSTSILGSLNKKMYDPMIQNSVEFCDLLAKNILKIQTLRTRRIWTSWITYN